MGKTIHLKSARTGKDPRFEITLQGFKDKKKIELEIYEVDTDDDSRKNGDTKIGSIEGTVDWPNQQDPTQNLKSTKAHDTKDEEPKIIFATDGGSKEFPFSPVSPQERDEGDSWEIQVRLKGDKKVRSRTWWVARVDRSVPSSKATYKWYRGNKVTLYNDASTDAGGSGGYFKDLDDALGEAEHFVFVADWSFHPHMHLHPGHKDSVGDKLISWAKKNKKGVVAIHVWDHTAPLGIGAPDAQNDGANGLLKKMGKPSNMFFRGTSRTGFGFSHHQKFVVMDCKSDDDPGRKSLRAFIGGIDLTKGRFDWPEHPIWPDHSDCKQLRKVTKYKVNEWYNAEFGDADLNSAKTEVKTDTFPRQPWHDIHCQVIGPTAWDVVREFVGRWHRDPSVPSMAIGDKIRNSTKDILKIFSKDVLFDKKAFVQQWEPHKGEWRAQILRSLEKDHWHWEGGKWKKPKNVITPAKKKGEFLWSIKSNTERSIQDAYIRAIGQAEKFVYLETQYFIGSGKHWNFTSRSSVKNTIQEALVQRIQAKVTAKEPFHVYLIIPMFPEGNPSGSALQAQRDFQWNSIGYIIRSIAGMGVKDWREYFTFGFLANWESIAKVDTTNGFWDGPTRLNKVKKNRRYMVYVHSKFMIVDDRYLIIGSANLNERSLAGDRDSEICVGLWPRLSKQEDCVKQVKAFRERLWTEHFGGKGKDFDTPETKGCAGEIQSIGDANWTLLEAGKTSDKGKTKKGHFVCWPIDGSKNDLGIRDKKKYIFDGLAGPVRGDDWYLWPTGYLGAVKGAAE